MLTLIDWDAQHRELFVNVFNVVLYDMHLPVKVKSSQKG
jgi:hypothetical protein